MRKPEVTRLDTTTEQNNTVGVYLVNPNPPDLETYNQEDMFIYASLTAYPKPRTLLTVENAQSSYFSGQDGDKVTFISTTKQNDKQYVTTNHLLYNGIDSPIEGFGITSIDVRLETNFVPTVTIKFYDTLGYALREFDEKRDTSGQRLGVTGSKNPLATFFSFPYPLYKLELKGYYGKAVSYCLHKIGFDVRFDSTKGGYEIEAKFIGYSYAFFNDLDMKMIFSIGNTERGRELLASRESMSFSDLLVNFAKLTRFVESLKIDSEEYLRASFINGLLARVNQLQRNVGVGINSSATPLTLMAGSNIAFAGVGATNTFSIRDYVVTTPSVVDGYNAFADIINQDISEINDLLTQLRQPNIPQLIKLYPSSFTSDDNDSLYPLPIDNNTTRGQYTGFNYENIVDYLNNKIREKENDAIGDTSMTVEDTLRYIDTHIKQVYTGNLQTSVFMPISFYETRKAINLTIETLRNKFDNLQLEISRLVNSAAEEIGFDPTVRSIFNVLSDNIEVFIQMLFDTAQKASNPAIQEGRRRIFDSIESDIVSGDYIYPFPEVAIDDKKSWLGAIPNINEEYFPEISLIKVFLNAFFDVNNPINRDEFINNLINRTVDIDKNDWFPLSPIDIGSNPLQSTNFTNVNQIYGELLARNIFGVSEFRTLAPSSNSVNFVNPFRTNTPSPAYTILASLEARTLFQNIKNSPLLDELIETEVDLTNPDLLQVLSQYGIPPQPNQYYIDNAKFNNNVSVSDENIFINLAKNNDLANKIKNRTNSFNSYISNYIESSNALGKLKEVYEFDYTDNFILTKDLSIKLLNNQYKRPRNVTSLSEVNSFIPVLVVNKDIIGKYQGDTYDNLFPNTKGEREKLVERKMGILLSIGYTEDIDGFLNSLRYSAIYKVPKLFNQYLGALMYLNDDSEYIDALDSKYQNSISVLSGKTDIFNNSVRDFFKREFDSMTGAEVELYETYLDVFNITANEIAVNTNTFRLTESDIRDTLVPVYAYLWDLYSSPIDIVLTSVNKLTLNNTYQTSQSLIDYCGIIKNMLKSLKREETNNLILQEQQINDLITNDPDLLVSVYESIRAIYAKWVGYNHLNGEVYNVCYGTIGDTEIRRLKNHFHYIDRAWNDIGDEVVINPRSILRLFNENEINAYQYITKILDENNFLVFIAPTYFGFRNEQDMVDMFTPQTSLKNMESFPSIIAMYHGGVAMHLATDSNGYKTDGFDFTAEGLPKDFKTRRVKAGNTQPDDGKYNLTSFLVNFGQQNQSHFKDLSISTTEHRNTSTYFQTISDIFDKGGVTKRFYKGIDIYDLYKFRSFKASITAMGNMMYQPMQYFQLNIPMFKGAYMITSVNHSFTPHDATTSFDGLKISKVVYPLVDKITSYLNLTYSEFFDRPQSELLSEALVLEDSIGYDNDQAVTNSIDTSTTSTNVLFAISPPNQPRTEYIIDDRLTISNLDSELRRVFRARSNYNISGYKCMKWVKYALADIGIIATPFSSGVHAWTLGANIDSSLLILSNPESIISSQGKLDYFNSMDNLAIVFGGYPNRVGGFANDAVNTFLSSNNVNLINRLKAYKQKLPANIVNSQYDIPPITHVGLVYNKTFYDFAKDNVRQGQVGSFIPVMHMNIYTKIKNKIS